MNRSDLYYLMAKPGDLVSWCVDPQSDGDEETVIKIGVSLEGKVTRLTCYGIYLQTYESFASIWNGRKEVSVPWAEIRSLVPRNTVEEVEVEMIEVLGVPSYMKGQF